LETPLSVREAYIRDSLHEAHTGLAPILRGEAYKYFNRDIRGGDRVHSSAMDSFDGPFVHPRISITRKNEVIREE